MNLDRDGMANREICVPGNAALQSCEESRWYSRGYLPHFDSPHRVQHVTIHLSDSLPKSAIEKVEQSIVALSDDQRAVERRRRLHEWIDAGHGSCLLNHEPCANYVQDVFLFFDNQRYRLFAWVVMPNHLHVLFQPINGWSMAKIVASWKKFTARRINDWVRANQEIRVPGDGVLANCEKPLWHHEYWDRYIRNERHYLDAIDYIHKNPVQAGLCATPSDWRWSSAYSG